MNVFQRRRQFFGGKKMVTITFHGNGGETVTGDVTVVMQVPVGIMWKDVLKPEFLQSATAKQQNGFTTIQGNDNSLIEPDYVVTSDMTVYASYTAIEIGIFTFDGEIMSAEKWIEKYDKNMYYYDTSGVNPTWKFNENYRDKLVYGVYFKASESKSFGLVAQYKDSYGKYHGGVDMQNKIGGSNLDLSQFGVTSVNARQMSSPTNPPYKFPGLFTPEDFDNTQNLGIPQSVINEILLFDNGKQDTDLFYQNVQGYTDNMGIVGSPYLEIIKNWSAGTTIPLGSFYIPSLFDLNLIAKNRQKVLDVIDLLNTSFSITGGVDVANIGYEYFPSNGMPGKGFNWYYGVLTQTTSSNITVWISSEQLTKGSYSGQTIRSTQPQQLLYDFAKETISFAYSGDSPPVLLNFNGGSRSSMQTLKVAVCDLSQLF